ncbi:MAG: hypothetical protein ACJAYH_002731 [Celeribacter sp.]|jgi:hypothetical protein
MRERADHAPFPGSRVAHHGAAARGRNLTREMSHEALRGNLPRFHLAGCLM